MPNGSTDNLELSQWIGADNLRRDDLNSDLKKIDDAVGAINEVAVNQGNQIEAIDTSILDINKNIDDVNIAVSERVLKVAGKDLSTENFTSEEKTKLLKVEAEANKYSHPATHTANMIVTTPTKRFIPDVLLSKLAGIEVWAGGLFASKTHNHSGTYEPVIAKKSGFNLDKSDSVTSTSSVILATLKAVKTAYDKAVSAYNLAAGKLGATSKAVDSSKLNGVIESTSGTANTIAKRNSSGDLFARLFSMSYATTNADVDRIVTISGTTGYMRPSTTEQVRDRMNVTRVTVSTSAPTSNVNAGDIWIDPNA